MAEDRYAATWRGARKYQFDEETRRKRRTLYWRTLKPWLTAGSLLCVAAFMAVYLMPTA